MDRLSTGKRINSSRGDAGGLAVASRMTAEIRGLGAAIRNANDGISLAQTAEGAMGEVTNMLQRTKELSVQSANGTLSDGDKDNRSEEHTSELQSLMRISYAVFCLKKKKERHQHRKYSRTYI